MQQTQQQTIVSGVTHPLVAGMFLKKRFGAPLSQQGQGSVLVIETRFPVDEDDTDTFKDCLNALLGDLPRLRAQAEASVGAFDRVDIRTAH